MEIVGAISKRLTNMRGITAWFYIGGALFISDRHPAIAEEVMWAAAFVAAAFLGVSGVTEIKKPTITGETK